MCKCRCVGREMRLRISPLSPCTSMWCCYVDLSSEVSIDVSQQDAARGMQPIMFVRAFIYKVGFNGQMSPTVHPHRIINSLGTSMSWILHHFGLSDLKLGRTRRMLDYFQSTSRRWRLSLFMGSGAFVCVDLVFSSHDHSLITTFEGILAIQYSIQYSTYNANNQEPEMK